MKHWCKIIVTVFFVLLLAISGYYVWNRMGKTYTKQLSTPIADQTPVTSLRIGSYNVKSLAMGEGLSAFVSDISDMNLDVIALQEVDQNSLRSENMNMIKEMGEAARYPYYYFYKTLWLVSGYYGLGILSRYPIEEVSSKSLPASLLEEPRILAGAVINVNGTKLHVYNTHVSYKNMNDRDQQVAIIKQTVQQQENTILMGDFNAFRNNTFTIEGMQSINWNKESYLTFRSFAAPDNIFYSKNLTLIDEGMKETSFSDHNLLYGELALPTGGT